MNLFGKIGLERIKLYFFAYPSRILQHVAYNPMSFLRILLLFALTEKSFDKKFSQKINENLIIGENQFKSSFMQKFKEVFSIYLSPIYIFYRIISSLVK